jgi:tartrate-resistant acid phosphatase type 5
VARSIMLKRSALIAVAISSASLCAPNLNARQAASGTEPAAAAATPSVEEQLIHHLPEDWRLTALRYHVYSDFDAPILTVPSGIEDEVRLTALRRLAGIPGAEEFVAKHLEDELANLRSSELQIPESAMRDVLIGVLNGLPYHPNWLNNPLTLPLLEKEAETDPDPKVSTAAVKALHQLEVRRLLTTVEVRLGQISYDYKNYKYEIDRLEVEDQELMYERDNIDITAIMQNPPPVFQVPTKNDSIRVAMMGDFGTRGEDQHKVAAAMVQENKKKPFDFGLTLGDNFYFNLTSPDDPQFKVAFEDLYGPLGITFYPCFGNHDWGGELPAVELAYSAKNPHWTFPAPYYTYTAGPVQFFVVNTEFQFDRPDGLYAGVSALQLRWLQSELEKSKATWKVVYGHVPIYTSLDTDNGPMEDLLEILKGRADFYISGHVHNLEQHKPVDGVNLFIIGSSGRGEVEVNDKDPDTIFAKEAYGFGVLEATNHDLTIRILGEDDKEMHVATFHK